MTTPQIVAAIDDLIDRLQSDPELHPDEVFDLVVQLQKIQAKAKVQAGMTMAALLDLKRAGIGLAPHIAHKFQITEGED